MKNSDESYLKAKERVKELREFYTHLFTFVIVNLFLAAINYYSNKWEYPWFLWVTFGWGIGLFFEGLKTFKINPFYNKDWEERKIREYMDKEKRQRWE